MPEYPSKAAPTAPAAPGSKVPTHPDVVFKPLPFFDVIGELMKLAEQSLAEGLHPRLIAEALWILLLGLA